MNRLKKGFFIGIEGIDGAGKTIQVKIISEKLAKKGYKVLTTFEPGGSSFGKDVRNIIANNNLDPTSQVFLLMADRFEHYLKHISPKLKQNNIILTDRSIDSTFAYQGYGYNLNLDWLRIWANINLPYCDLTFWLKLDVELAFKRINSRKKNPHLLNQNNEIQEITLFEEKEYLKKVAYGYQKIYDSNDNRIKIIDASKSIEEVTSLIIQEIEKKISNI